ncbi:MAG TPA: calcium-binding protein [Nocardioides sp.]|nr:calcium-binding protein [Nocardioides sp.]
MSRATKHAATRAAVLVPVLALVAPLGFLAGTSAPAAAAETCDGKAPTILAVPGVTTTGTSGDDVILGTVNNDAIDGGAGNDTICGLVGSDTLVGGAGNDRLFGGLDNEYYPDDGYRGDLLVPGPGDDHVDLGDDPVSATVDDVDRPANYDSISYRGASGPVVVDLVSGTATGEGADTIAAPQFSGGIVGSAHDDVLIGTQGPDRIRGGGGDDRIIAGDGDDDIEPDHVGPPSLGSHDPTLTAAGHDLVRAGEGEDYVLASHGHDRIFGDGGRDGVHASGPGSDVGGGAGKDYLVGGKGVSVHGGGGDDEIGAALGRRKGHEVDGGPGRDVVRLRARKAQFDPGTQWVVDVPRERVTADGRKRLTYERVEDLRFSSPRGRLTYLGGAGRDLLYAGSGLRITAYGRTGRDVLVGGRLADLLDGGPGRDQLVGGPGRDRCLNGEQVRQCEVRR